MRPFLLDHVIPVRCVSCRALVADTPPSPTASERACGSCRPRGPRRPPICRNCLSLLVPLSGPRCHSCGVPLVSEQDHCVRCRSREIHYTTHRAVFAYVGAVRRVIAAYKFAGRRSLGPLLCGFLARELERSPFRTRVHGGFRDQPGPESQPPLIVPVPASRGGRRRRGFDQVDELAAVLERSRGVEVARLLSRGRTGEQKTLDFAGRSRNLAGAVRVRRGTELRGRRVILIDDVFTTGATINECARVLLEAGASRVDAVTLAAD